jgi:hypothetical protein
MSLFTGILFILSVLSFICCVSYMYVFFQIFSPIMTFNTPRIFFWTKCPFDLKFSAGKCVSQVRSFATFPSFNHFTQLGNDCAPEIKDPYRFVFPFYSCNMSLID